jgi:glycosyltransferase involved in cell wall biosynthesis
VPAYNERMRVLLGAHTIDPTAGGEPGIGWGWAEALARQSEIERVEVVAHPLARESIEAALARDALLAEKLRFHWVVPDRRIDPWKGDVPGKKVWHRLLLHYQLWQRAAAEAARTLGATVDVAHHVTLGSVYLRTFVTQSVCPYIIGPVGGGQAASVGDSIRLCAHAPDAHSALEVARSLLIKPVGRRPVLRRRLARASVVLCANSQTLEIAKRHHARAELMIDGGVRTLPPPAQSSLRRPTVLWVGKLEARKDPLAALQVFVALRAALPSARMIMVGGGWLQKRVEAEVSRHGLFQSVDLVGHVPFAEMSKIYSMSSVFLFTSIRDTFGVQNLEAMSYGLPIVYRASRGVGIGDFSGSSSVGVPNGSHWVSNAAREIVALIEDRVTWEARSQTAIELARGFTWRSKASRAVELYRESYQARNAACSR